uniref:Uncharacterized protein n=1 Tax=Oryza barthii TaxID=65489 RepID=A0A0D3HTJ6_9ORYZ
MARWRPESARLRRRGLTTEWRDGKVRWRATRCGRNRGSRRLVTVAGVQLPVFLVQRLPAPTNSSNDNASTSSAHPATHTGREAPQRRRSPAHQVFRFNALARHDYLFGRVAREGGKLTVGYGAALPSSLNRGRRNGNARVIRWRQERRRRPVVTAAGGRRRVTPYGDAGVSWRPLTLNSRWRLARRRYDAGAHGGAALARVFGGSVGGGPTRRGATRYGTRARPVRCTSRKGRCAAR